VAAVVDDPDEAVVDVVDVDDEDAVDG